MHRGLFLKFGERLGKNYCTGSNMPEISNFICTISVNISVNDETLEYDNFIRDYCGQSFVNVTTEDSGLMLEFRTDGTVQRPGFNLR